MTNTGSVKKLFYNKVEMNLWVVFIMRCCEAEYEQEQYSLSSDPPQWGVNMAGQKFEYDESGSTFFYFLTSFLGLVLLPCTFYFWPDGAKEGRSLKPWGYGHETWGHSTGLLFPCLFPIFFCPCGFWVGGCGCDWVSGCVGVGRG